MENYNELIQTIALTMGSAWASGINVYATIFVLSFGAMGGHITLPESMMFLDDPLIMGVAGFMYFVEFFADKTPVVDTGWDSIHTFVRIPAGAVLAFSAVGDVDITFQIVAGLLGGAMATATHATKASSRVMINASPEPFTNWGASITEDIVVIAGLYTALNHPTAFVIFLVLFVLLLIWLLPKLWGGLKKLVFKIKSLFGYKEGSLLPKNEPKPQESTNNLQNTEVWEKLANLKQMHESGLIDSDEYKKKKDEVMGMM